MSTDRDAREIRLWTIGITLGLAAFFLLPVVAMMFTFAIDVPRQKTLIKDRHAEARALIEYVYAYFDSHGEWPAEDVVTTAFPQTMNDGWSYNPGGESWMPMISLHGPYHMSIAYYFLAPSNGHVTRDWIFSFEGSKEGFQSTHAYHLPP